MALQEDRTVFRRRPPPWQPPSPDPPVSPQPAPGLPDWAHGFFYLAPQSRLYFGSDRRVPVTRRPVVSLVQQGEICQLLPATRHPRRKADFFHLRAEDGFFRRAPAESPADSYLYYVAEALPAEVLTVIGVLPHPLRIRIADWLKERLDA